MFSVSYSRIVRQAFWEWLLKWHVFSSSRPDAEKISLGPRHEQGQKYAIMMLKYK
jgi:hypothetical protein